MTFYFFYERSVLISGFWGALQDASKFAMTIYIWTMEDNLSIYENKYVRENGVVMWFGKTN